MSQLPEEVPQRRGRAKGADGTRMTLVEHLGELRRRIIVSMLAVAAGAVVAYIFFADILHFLSGPYRDVTGRDNLLATGVLDPFLTRLRIAAYGGLVLASPVVLFQLWRFITPGLEGKEKRYAVPFVGSSLALFLLGGFVALESLDKTLDFLLGMGGGEIETWLTADRYLGFITLMLLAFGVAFQLPIVLVFLLIARVIDTRQLRSIRRYAFVSIVAAAAILTPSQDPFTMFMMAIPMYVFYEASILIGRVLKR